MQNRYTADVGDFVKYGLLRALAGEQRLGIAWYLYPDESHNSDGRHIQYLSQPDEWSALDAELFASLKEIVSRDDRSVEAIEKSTLFPSARFSGDLLDTPTKSPRDRAIWRQEWFERVLIDVSECEIVFADPDNGLCADDKFRPARRKDWKRMPLREARRLSENHTIVLYHNSRFAGGHRREIEHWMDQLPGRVYGLYWRRYSPRTFFVVNPSPAIEQRLHNFVELWGHGCELLCSQ